MTVEVISLGCRLNIAESEAIRGFLADGPPTVVVNSCAVTAEAVRQSRKAVRKLRREHPDARLVVTGCAATIEADAFAAMPEVDAVVSNTVKLLQESWLPREGGGLGVVKDRLRPPPSRGSSEGSARGSNVGLHTRAFVPVQNGCDHACTFCIIPQGRGKSVSLQIVDVLSAVENAIFLNSTKMHRDAPNPHQGVNEVVLTGVDVTSWGADLPGAPKLGDLVAAILDAFPTLPRIRLSSLDGVEIDPLLFELITSEQRVMPHVHISLQSGNDMILKRMKRRHSRGQAIELVQRMKARRPEIAIGADLIAGFPTETAEMHAENVSIVRECGIVHGHIFPYSPRPGTPAARMPQVNPVLVRERAAQVRAAVAEERARWLGTLIGKPAQVLAERDGTGHAPHFASYRVPHGTPAGSLVTVTPTKIVEGILE
ncbi:MAG: tRNA (N(6)-L-threonylcarbamoyladenosine(37)-C(2))-methylthiotransferase MtaB [Novosphingobium sp. 28-62-57]|uniref:MiaB/RimO family radical SAM methylthiotransferase n=1 Tax=unclassified Novosphingobium TaxID=2644732 RepID=UPI000BD912E1|nr:MULTISPECIES: MiaB/RimO family radical SAM methylthiotransferase [unclassified Novosphingobium]OYW48820.1 MAG: tRNA (N(6)-L-threonylcarbamoyladenosine(37)-C(2))-methylthiotransferase MtaB [Novosphingobium sp. 12-62-10]OYZ12023.1 MAG: tRNA (N(6)-L-threonylcarbamoyladenosine(37)-C(2))-methylthiotransferase MtaB [Novosphingobium sp. 28-62-57]OZA31612.1 MAG: tRNA (N(6)-L-threonylcarbamoyladenosine(37)-C(2))-methylthiotransferase MtaB [Novosphingobium sp. 17-62-9]HQS70773.1 MiaB/RimO family radic